jgi:hypothetical protein
MIDHRQSGWKTALGCLLSPFLLLIVPLIPLLTWFGWNKLNAKPSYVAEYLEKFIAGTEGGWDWDDFCSIPLTDSTLDGIRDQACRLWKPGGLTESDIEHLRGLLDETRSLEGKPH